MKPLINQKNGTGSDNFVARAKRAMLRASDKAMEDYKRFGVDPVVTPSSICAKKVKSSRIH